jgi:hypothetical protein
VAAAGQASYFQAFDRGLHQTKNGNGPRLFSLSPRTSGIAQTGRSCKEFWASWLHRAIVVSGISQQFPFQLMLIPKVGFNAGAGSNSCLTKPPEQHLVLLVQFDITLHIITD